MSTILTTEKLALALEACNDPALKTMIKLARMGHYDDYKSELVAPIFTLVIDAVNAGHPEIAERAKNGDFDATKEESNAYLSSPEGQEIINNLINKE